MEVGLLVTVWVAVCVGVELTVGVAVVVGANVAVELGVALAVRLGSGGPTATYVTRTDDTSAANDPRSGWHEK